MRHFAERFDITVTQAESLRHLVDLAAKAQEDEHSDPVADHARIACDTADGFAAILGLRLDWNPGIYPLVVKGELSEHLPED